MCVMESELECTRSELDLAHENMSDSERVLNRLEHDLKKHNEHSEAMSEYEKIITRLHTELAEEREVSEGHKLLADARMSHINDLEAIIFSIQNICEDYEK